MPDLFENISGTMEETSDDDDQNDNDYGYYCTTLSPTRVCQHRYYISTYLCTLFRYFRLTFPFRYFIVIQIF